ncbi:hypothetical protein [Gracilimonas sp.]|uniref:hypothetical protein n=1 Tax=Gracilimonas sp. TaxID=1974203 RepID=UPI003BAC7CA5
MKFIKKIIPESLFQKVFIGLMLLFAITNVWVAFTVFSGIQSVLDSDISPDKTTDMTSYSSTHSFEVLSFRFTKTANIDTMYTYVTLKDLTFSPSKEKRFEILSAASKDEQILGLSSHPSYLVSESQRSFWKKQLYMEMAFIIGGFILFMFLLVWVSSFNKDDYMKLFSKKIYRWATTLFFMVLAVFIVDGLLYARKINFLNKEFNLNLSPTGGISPTMIFITILLVLVLIFLWKGIPMQNEQDLTV